MTQMTWSQTSFENTKFGWLSFWLAARLNYRRGWHVLKAWRGPSVSPVMFWKQCRVWQMLGSLPQGLFGSLCYHVLKYNGSISLSGSPVGTIGTNPMQLQFLLHIVVTLRGERGETIILNPHICILARHIDVRWLKRANLNRYNCCSQPWIWEISSAAKTNLFETERLEMAPPRKLSLRFRLSRYVPENVFSRRATWRWEEVRRFGFFWILFAGDNVYKPRSEARSAVTAAKIDHWHKSQRLNTQWRPRFLTLCKAQCGAIVRTCARTQGLVSAIILISFYILVYAFILTQSSVPQILQWSSVTSFLCSEVKNVFTFKVASR